VLILRPVAERDLDDLVALAAQLDSMNLPSDRDFLAQRIHDSLRSFAGHTGRRCEAAFVFVLEDCVAHRCVGTSTILAKHGTPESPHYWLELSTEERSSPSLGRRFHHDRLRLRWSTDGPTEVGGLILDTSYRHHAEKCGKALSIVRFAYIAAHPEAFEREVIAEMLSPFDGDGHNRLWDAFGARFTGLSFREADRLSTRNKSFIADLFPREPVYATLFPDAVREVIGRPNETAVAAVRILERIGFRYLKQVDPFDGGPYLGCARDAIASVRERRELVLPSGPDDGALELHEPLALLSAEGSFGFRATVVPIDEEGFPRVAKECREALGVDGGDRVAVTPLP
jgi:arginine N-succinyltransferase